MLPKELQDEIDIEINKTSPEMQAFIRDKYLAETIETICRVNSLNNNQKNALYLEIVMQLVGINDYADFAESIKNELKIDEKEIDAETVRQIVKDVDDYVFNKIKEQDVSNLSIRERLLKEVSTTDERSIEFLTKPKLETTTTETQNIESSPKIEETESVPDVYREIPEAVDKTIKHE